jgi:aryl-alcohol dehydrogenase-like predicted oxidoreductase
LGMLSFANDAQRAWVLDDALAEPIVKAAIDAGITFFDTADSYSGGESELATGRLLKKLISRDEMVLSTKVYFDMTAGPNGRGLSRKHIMAAIDASLTRLGMDYVDIYQIHRWDSNSPAEETMRALHDVVQSGKARYIGASTMCAWEFARAQRVAAANGWTEFVSMQNHYNLLYREEGRGTARSGDDPVADSFYGELDLFWPVIERLQAVAAERGLPPAQIALAWLLHKPGVTSPVIGATKPHHVSDAAAAAALVLTPEEIARLEEPYSPLPVIGHGVPPGART